MSSTDVFISHSSKEKDIILDLKKRLNDAGVKEVWVSEELLEGDRWAEEINRKIEDTILVVVLISAASVCSSYVTYEWCYAHFERRTRLYFIELGNVPERLGVNNILKNLMLQKPSTKWDLSPTDNQLQEAVEKIKLLTERPSGFDEMEFLLLNTDADNDKRIKAVKAIATWKGMRIQDHQRMALIKALKGQLVPRKMNGELATEIVSSVSLFCSPGDKVVIDLLERLKDRDNEGAGTYYLQTTIDETLKYLRT